MYHKGPSSRSPGLERAVISRTENHGFFLGQELSQNHKSPFLEQSIELEMNVAELTGREALLLSTEAPHSDASQGEDAARLGAAHIPGAVSPALSAQRPEGLLGTASLISLWQRRDHQEHFHLWKPMPGPSPLWPWYHRTFWGARSPGDCWGGKRTQEISTWPLLVSYFFLVDVRKPFALSLN